MGRIRTARNVAIVLAIAAAVDFLPGGGRAASTFGAALRVGFGVGFAYLGVRLYREHRISLHGLGDRQRALLYGAVVLAVFLYAARPRMWGTTLGELLWFGLLGLVVYGAMDVYRRWRAY